jgi:hypothetical protein
MFSIVPRLARASRHRLRSFSTTSSPEPLFLWMGGGDVASDSSTTPLLLPKYSTTPTVATVTTPDDILHQVNDFYEKSHFVGGMGEEDPGVWFAACHGHGDALDYAELVQEGVFMTKQERHGVQFGLYTNGLVTPSIPLSELGLSTLQVSLCCGSPPEYAKATGRDAKAFGQLCGFIVDAVEQGVTVEVGVLEPYAGSARDLALSLGAQQVHVFPNPNK